jgi:hypothetical protein
MQLLLLLRLCARIIVPIADLPKEVKAGQSSRVRYASD